MLPTPAGDDTISALKSARSPVSSGCGVVWWSSLQPQSQAARMSASDSSTTPRRTRACVRCRSDPKSATGSPWSGAQHDARVCPAHDRRDSARGSRSSEATGPTGSRAGHRQAATASAGWRAGLPPAPPSQDCSFDLDSARSQAANPGRPAATSAQRTVLSAIDALRALLPWMVV